MIIQYSNPATLTSKDIPRALDLVHFCGHLWTACYTFVFGTHACTHKFGLRLPQAIPVALVANLQCWKYNCVIILVELNPTGISTPCDLYCWVDATWLPNINGINIIGMLMFLKVACDQGCEQCQAVFAVAVTVHGYAG